MMAGLTVNTIITINVFNSKHEIFSLPAFDVGVAYDLSSNALLECRQCGATFMAIYLSTSKSQATILCSLDGLFTLAWGKKEKVKLPKDWSNNRLKDEEKKRNKERD